MRDYYNDPYEIEFARISKVYGLGEDFNAKQASDPAPSFQDYAYPEKLLYPIDTPERTTLSWCYAKESKELPVEVRSRVYDAIKQAADFWEIELPTRMEEVDEDALDPIVLKVASEGKEDTYTIDRPEGIRQVVDQITKNASDFTYDTRRQLAEQVLSAPTCMKVRLNVADIQRLQKIAGDMLVTGVDVKNACTVRARVLEHEGAHTFAEAVKEAGDVTKGDAILSKSALVKVARVIDYATRAAGLKEASDDPNLPLVEDMFRGVPAMELQRFNDSVIALKTGSAVFKSSITRNREAVNEFFSKLAGEDVSTLNDIDLFTRIENCDEIESDAFTNITGLTVR